MTKKLATELSIGSLWYDGILEVTPEKVEDLFREGLQPSQIRVTEITNDIEQFNSMDALKILKRDVNDLVDLNFDWNLPEEYRKLDPEIYVRDLILAFIDNSPHDYNTIIDRVDAELAEFRKRKLLDFLRAVIYIVDVLDGANIPWGVGRGSSCASYVLYLIGLHQVDCLLYDVQMEEFFHD